MTESPRRRRRPAVSCSLCRKRKIRCNREFPCNNCLRSRNGVCVYEDVSSQPVQHQEYHRQGRGTTSATGLLDSVFVKSPSTKSKESVDRSTRPSSRAVDLESTSHSPIQQSARVTTSENTPLMQLAGQLSQMTPRSFDSPVTGSKLNAPTASSCIGQSFYIHSDSSIPGQPPGMSHSVTHKARRFGRSHWMNVVTLLQDICEIMEPHLREENSSVFSALHKCKSLAKGIKSRRTPPWPTTFATDLTSKVVADALVDCYFRTTETIYRVLHIPSFMKSYHAIWLPNANPDKQFLVQLKLVLSIGATSHDKSFSLSASAVRWVHEALTWLSEPKVKPRLGISFLQISILVLIAQESANVGRDSIWISTGALLRRAMSMGLHRDPPTLPKTTTFTVEMRRRLWNTILELSLQSSLTSGGPPLISLHDFDTEPPSNYNDEQLMSNDPISKREGEFTDISIAIALRKTFHIRLAIARYLNDLSSPSTYEEALRLDTQLRASHKSIRQTFHDPSSGAKSQRSLFGIQAMDYILHRYLTALHVPFLGAALHDTTFAFSRKVVVDTSLKVWGAVCPSSSIMTNLSGRNDNKALRGDFARFVTNGSGFWRIVAMWAAVLIALELRAQIREDEGLGPVPLRQDLLAVLDEAKTWCLQSIEAGETSVKGYMLLNVISAHIDGLLRGLHQDEIPDLLIAAAGDAHERCFPILERLVGKPDAEALTDGVNTEDTAATLNATSPWDLMMPDSLFQLENADPMGWMFDDETMEAPSFW